MSFEVVDTSLATLPFKDAWAKVMCKSEVRDWLFNQRPASATELYRGLRNHALLSGYWFGTPSVPFPDYYGKQWIGADLYFHCCERGTTSLGVAFNSKMSDPIVPSLYARTHDEDFNGPVQLSVRRLAIDFSPRNKDEIFILEFNWLENGVLDIVYSPMSMKHAQNPDEKSAAYEQLFAFVFRKRDAAILADCAKCPTDSFLRGCMSGLGLRGAFYRLSLFDTSFQRACMYCLSRGASRCECPTPLRRRAERCRSAYDYCERSLVSHHDPVTADMPESCKSWENFVKIQEQGKLAGAYVANWTCSDMDTHEKVVHSTFLPFNYFVRKGPQMHFGAHEIIAQTGIKLVSPYSAIGVPSGAERSVKAVGAASAADSVETHRSGQETLAGEHSELEDLSHTLSQSGVTESYVQITVPFSMAQSRCTDETEQTSLDDESKGRQLAQMQQYLVRQQLHESDHNATASMEMDSGASGEGDGKVPSSDMDDVHEANIRKVSRMGTECGKARILPGGREGKQRIFRCPVCGIAIKNKRSNLNRHIANKHSLERKFVCEVNDCGRKFQTRLNRTRHVKTVHEGRPFQCASCTRSFKTDEDLKQHERDVHPEGGEFLACRICGSCFAKRCILNRHIENVHKEETED